MSKTMLVDVPEIIKSLKDFGITYERLAVVTGAHVQNVYGWAKGFYRPTQKRLKKIVRLYEKLSSTEVQ